LLLPFLWGKKKDDQSATLVDLPQPDGTLVTLLAEDTTESAMSPALMAKYPEIRTFHLRSADGVLRGELEFNVNGFHSHLFNRSGKVHSYIEPVSKQQNLYISYFKEDYLKIEKQQADPANRWNCNVRDEKPHEKSTQAKA
jgi:hypothetical protein